MSQYLILSLKHSPHDAEAAIEHARRAAMDYIADEAVESISREADKDDPARQEFSRIVRRALRTAGEVSPCIRDYRDPEPF